MQIHRDSDFSSYGIVSYASGEVTVLVPASRPGDSRAPEPAAIQGTRREVISRSLMIMPDFLLPEWPPQSWAELEPAHFDMLAEHDPEVVLFGSGARLRHPSPSLYAGLIRRGIGVEVMDTGSACRTYNFLMTDHRRVLAALLMIED